MNIDTKLPAFKSYMSENKLGKGSVKTSIDNSSVLSGKQANVDLNLSTDEEKSSYGKQKKKKKNDLKLPEENKTETTEVKKNDAEVKAMNLKLLNLL